MPIIIHGCEQAYTRPKNGKYRKCTMQRQSPEISIGWCPFFGVFNKFMPIAYIGIKIKYGGS
jgi:hypothetical protein